MNIVISGMNEQTQSNELTDVGSGTSVFEISKALRGNMSRDTDTCTTVGNP